MSQHPAKSPQLDTARSLDPDLEEPKTDPGMRVDAAYLKVKIAQAQAIIDSQHREQLRQAEKHTDEQLEKSLKKHDNKLTLRSVFIAGSAVAGGVILALIFIDTRVHAQTEAGVEVMTEKHDVLKGRVETLEQRFNRFEERTDKQMNAALDALRVPDTKRPPPLKDPGP